MKTLRGIISLLTHQQLGLGLGSLLCSPFAVQQQLIDHYADQQPLTDPRKRSELAWDFVGLVQDLLRRLDTLLPIRLSKNVQHHTTVPPYM